MTESTEQDCNGASWSRFVHVVWGAGFVALIVYAIARLELLPLYATVATSDGAVRLPRAFFTVDHPFHTARADLVLNAWSSLDTVRWVASHQGGYPSEFFPFGLPAVAAAVTLLTAGALAIESAWAIVIVAVFLLPGLAWFLIGREDGLAPGVALVALAGQVTIASDWTNGGFTELVEWGLATNVAGATYALLAIPLVVRAIERRLMRAGALASIVIALCAVSNPRSLIAVCVVAVATLALTALTGRWRDGVLGIGAIGILALGLSAPVVMPLLRYSDLYFFLSYEEYAGVSDYWRETVASVTWPVIILASFGACVAFLSPRHRATRVASLSLALYMAITALAAASGPVRELIPQLELPRLMPFQRFLIIYLAAYGAMELGRRAIPVHGGLRFGRDLGLAAILSVALVASFTTSIGPVNASERGLREVPRTGGVEGQELEEFRAAISLADEEAPDQAAILVIGSRLSWHEQLWAPMVAENRRFYYDNWLWYWHRLHDGPYDYRAGHHYPNPSEALREDYLRAHGIGAVVVTDVADQATGANVRSAARSSDVLRHADTIGQWDIYVVPEAISLGSINGQPADEVRVSGDSENITIVFSDAEPGTLLVRQNWFPRWLAEVNGETAAVERAANGYMEIQVPGGDVEVELTYEATSADVFARAAAITSALVAGAMVIAPGPTARWARRLWLAGRARGHR